MKTKKLDIRDVAREAGVSISTVSRVINKSPAVKEDNRRRVEEAIKKLNYSPNVTAQRLASRKTNVAMLVIPKFQNIFKSFYITQIIKGAGEAAADFGMDLLLHIASADATAKKLQAGGYQGIIFADVDGGENLILEAAKGEMPVVVLNSIIEARGVNFIAPDNKSGALSVVDYLAGLGHKRIATITGDLKVQSAALRLEGFKEGLKKNNIKLKDEYIAEGDFTAGSGHKAMRKLLSLSEPPSAVFVASDDMALEAMRAVQEKDLKVPDDVSVVGFDDNPIASIGNVPLTSVSQPLIEMARKAVEIIHRQSEGGKPSAVKLLLPTALVMRSSTRRVY